MSLNNPCKERKGHGLHQERALLFHCGVSKESLEAVLYQGLLTYPWSRDGVNVVRLSVELIADISVKNIFLTRVQILVQGCAGEVLDALMKISSSSLSRHAGGRTEGGRKNQRST